MKYDCNIKWKYWSMKNFVGFIVDEIDFMIWIDYKRLTLEMKCLPKMKRECKKGLIKLVKLYGKN